MSMQYFYCNHQLKDQTRSYVVLLRGTVRFRTLNCLFAAHFKKPGVRFRIFAGSCDKDFRILLVRQLPQKKDAECPICMPHPVGLHGHSCRCTAQGVQPFVEFQKYINMTWLLFIQPTLICEIIYRASQLSAWVLLLPFTFRDGFQHVVHNGSHSIPDRSQTKDSPKA